jgi:C4-dicarboxylate-specific signal transduction histidine kinase
VVNYLENDLSTNKKEVLEILNYYNINNNYSSIYIINENGTAVVSTDQSFVDNNYSFREYFKKALAGHFFTDAFIGVTSGELGYYFSTPIVSEKGDILGAAIAKLKPEVINKIIERQNEAYKSLMLVDKYGIVIYSNDESRMYHSLGVLSDIKLSEINSTFRFANKNIVPLGYQIVQDEINF